jgi:glycine/D-amino acid oxidase-like deaminating enzyme
MKLHNNTPPQKKIIADPKLTSTHDVGGAGTPIDDAKGEQAVIAPKLHTDAFETKAPGTSAADGSRDTAQLLAKFGLEQEKRPVTEKRFAANVRKLVKGLVERTAKFVKHSFSVMGAFGLAVRNCSSMHDIRQLQDFVTLAVKNGHPEVVFSLLSDIAGFLLKYPDDARRVINFVAKQERQMTAQRSVWMQPALVELSKLPKAPPAKADIVVIGGGISAAYMSRHFAKAQKDGDPNAAGRNLLVLEKDTKEKREHMASLRNAGIVCTALDYLFEVEDILGDKAIGRIKDALKVDTKEATKIQNALMKVMGDATGVIQQFLKEKNVDIELRPAGGLDVATSKEDLEAFARAAEKAREYGLDWRAIDAAVLKDQYGIEAPHIEGAILFDDSAQLHPGKLVNALFEYATQTSKDVKTSYGTELIGAEEDPKGGWVLHTRMQDENGGWVARDVHANEVIDAREAYAPYHFREARFSQIHIIDTSQDDRPMHVEDTHICHGFTYMRKVADNKFLVGSGDFPLTNPNDTPPLMASVALYAFANFMKVYPNAKFDLERAWGGVFGLNHSEVPCVGELLKGWQVVGGSGGSGMNLTPALGEQAIANVLGHQEAGPMAADGFSPRQYTLVDIRTDLAKALQQFEAYKDITLEHVQLELGPRTSTTAAKRGDDLVFTIDEKTLDAASILAAPLFGERAEEELRQRMGAKSDFIAAMTKLVDKSLHDGKLLVLSPDTSAPAPGTRAAHKASG